jgi:hypothetical protein
MKLSEKQAQNLKSLWELEAMRDAVKAEMVAATATLLARKLTLDEEIDAIESNVPDTYEGEFQRQDDAHRSELYGSRGRFTAQWDKRIRVQEQLLKLSA